MPAKTRLSPADRRSGARKSAAPAYPGDKISRELKEKLFRTFWNSSRDMVFFFDEDLKLIDLNKTALKFVRKHNGKGKATLVGRQMIEIFPLLKGSDRYEKYLDVIRTGKPVSFTHVRLYKFPKLSGSIYAFRALNGLGLICTDESLSARIKSDLKATIEVLERLAAHNLALREEESRCLARKIHDELSPSLSIIKMELFWLSSKLKTGEVNPPVVLDRITGMTSILDDSITSIRNICSELRPALLDDLGLYAAIEWKVRESEKWYPIRCRLSFDGHGLKLDPDLSLCLFRVFNEGYANILRHSQATQASILLRHVPADNKIEMKIRDNGRGIRPGEISNPRSFGLIGIRERLWPYKGRMSIHGRPEKGTTLTISIPTPPEITAHGRP